MQIIQKISAILYSVWAIFEGYVLLNSIIYDTSTIGLNGVNYFDKISFWSLVVLLLILSLFTSSVFLVIIAFLKKDSKKRNIFTIIWLVVNVTLVFLIPEISYVTDKMVVICTVFNINANQTIFTILCYILSKNVLIVISLINIVLLSLKLGGICHKKV